jgi:mono/diheme cytochrome c family protein
MQLIMITVAVLLVLVAPVVGSDLQEGKRLFHEKTLGSNGKNCATCHAGGKGLESAGEYNEEMLQDYVNFCIRDALKGKLLPSGDPQLVALEKYVRTFHEKQ